MAIDKTLSLVCLYRVIHLRETGSLEQVMKTFLSKQSKPVNPKFLGPGISETWVEYLSYVAQGICLFFHILIKVRFTQKMKYQGTPKELYYLVVVSRRYERGIGSCFYFLLLFGVWKFIIWACLKFSLKMLVLLMSVRPMISYFL